MSDENVHIFGKDLVAWYEENIWRKEAKLSGCRKKEGYINLLFSVEHLKNDVYNRFLCKYPPQTAELPGTRLKRQFKTYSSFLSA